MAVGLAFQRPSPPPPATAGARAPAAHPPPKRRAEAPRGSLNSVYKYNGGGRVAIGRRCPARFACRGGAPGSRGGGAGWVVQARGDPVGWRGSGSGERPARRVCRALWYPALRCFTLRRGDRLCVALHCFALLHCTALLCTALHRAALHRTALHCTALHGSAVRLRCVFTPPGKPRVLSVLLRLAQEGACGLTARGGHKPFLPASQRVQIRAEKRCVSRSR